MASKLAVDIVEETDCAGIHDLSVEERKSANAEIVDAHLAAARAEDRALIERLLSSLKTHVPRMGLQFVPGIEEAREVHAAAEARLKEQP